MAWTAQGLQFGLPLGAAWHPLDLGTWTAWMDDTTMVDRGSGDVDWENHSDASGGSSWDLHDVFGSGVTTSSMNGVPCWHIDGTSALRATSQINRTPSTSNPVTVVMVWSIDTYASYSALFAGQSGAASPNQLWSISTNSNFNSGIINDTPLGSVNTSEVFCTIVTYQGGTDTEMSMGGIGYKTGVDQGSTDFEWGTIGANRNATLVYPFTGKVAAVGVYEGLPTKSEKDLIYNWANSTYGAKTFIDPLDLSPLVALLPDGLSDDSGVVWLNSTDSRVTGGSTYDLSESDGAGPLALTTVNGLTALDTTGGSGYLAPSSPTLISDPWSLVACLKFDTLDAGNNEAISGTDRLSSSIAIYQDATGYSTYTDGNLTIAGRDNNLRSVGTCRGTSSDLLRVSGKGNASGSLGTLGLRYLWVGKSSSFDAHIHCPEILVYDSQLTATNIDDIAAYHSYTYGSEI